MEEMANFMIFVIFYDLKNKKKWEKYFFQKSKTQVQFLHTISKCLKKRWAKCKKLGLKNGRNGQFYDFCHFLWLLKNKKIEFFFFKIVKRRSDINILFLNALRKDKQNVKNCA